jgi:glutamate formiminotransferase/formiminotetrahydrofolate cyclodeaminase
MAAGLAAMVAGMSRGKKAYLQHQELHNEVLARLGTLRDELKAAIDHDADAFKSLMAAFKAAREDGSGAAQQRITDATKQAVEVPLGVVERAKEIVGIVERLRGTTNPNMDSDLTTATALANAAVYGALANVAINMKTLDDADFDQQVTTRLQSSGIHFHREEPVRK